MNVKIKEIPVNDRPRERLLNSGVEVLSNEELLAILLKTGTKDMSVKMVASNLLKKLKSLSNLKDVNVESLTKIKGIGKAKACELIAAIELGRRLNQKINDVKEIKIGESYDVFEYYNNFLSDKKQEYFYCIYLDNKKRVIKDKLIYIGSINQSMVHPREVFKEAYLIDASAIICVHNHPSNKVEPSQNDIVITNQLVEAGEFLEVKIVDHIIIGRDRYFSFLENGYIKI